MIFEVHWVPLRWVLLRLSLSALSKWDIEGQPAILLYMAGNYRFLYIKQHSKINRVYHKECLKSNNYIVYCPFRGRQGPCPQGFHSSRGLRTLAEWSAKNALFREHLRRSHQYWWGWSTPVVIDQGSKSSGTGPGPLEAINDPVSRVHSIFGKSHGSASSASSTGDVELMRGYFLDAFRDN